LVVRLDLVPIYLSAQDALLQRLSVALERALPATVCVLKPWFDPERSFDPSRGQYCSTTLLRLLLSSPPDAADRILGVSGVDLFAPVLTYVFGEAQLDGRVAVVSVHRLRTELYGLPRNDELVTERLVKEAIHELGHTFGLLHCAALACVMHASTYVEEIDLKPASYCDSCLQALHESTEHMSSG
jgi:archaemetzincin